MARTLKKIPPKIIEVLKEAAETMALIEGKSVTKETKDYETLVAKIVNGIIKKKKVDILAYDTMVRVYPQTRNIINQLIKEVRLFSLYDREPATINFDYSAYLKQIEELAEIR